MGSFRARVGGDSVLRWWSALGTVRGEGLESESGCACMWEDRVERELGYKEVGPVLKHNHTCRPVTYVNAHCADTG